MGLTHCFQVFAPVYCCCRRALITRRRRMRVTARRWGRGRNNAAVLFCKCFEVYRRLRYDAAVLFRKRFVVHYGNLASLLNLAAASALGNVMTVPLGSVTVFPAAAAGAPAGICAAAAPGELGGFN